MKLMMVCVAVCLIAGCGEMKPVEGAPEIQVRDDLQADISVQPDGQRLVILRTGEAVRAIILLPPAKVATPEASKVTTPVLLEK